ncbi:hypothetical protein SELMODRAFT_76727 [Selaginella moellendorffii]|uniref:arginine--tRNA ligase n=1 Tax=Selaginella moellendorffii TaxID=88036 RepID=D8QSZ8_SELML|nr:arginine--tRNA ligase, chloroplastic/mitochondrial isoform X1 [Selaginella moellendorffii]EFJ37526.1 hypothetical protein SELMODRAFT_76727 [Selaginella moellendorffii]|eukprot:XP_002962266.1 arginine--tRNA ligase, chloroplastic/mitochondrial isoform X1 [Selaginella moellendorffii]
MARCPSVRSEISQIFQAAFRSTVGEWVSVEPIVTACNNPKFGDYQINNAMGIWSRIKGMQSTYGNPVSIAQDVLRNIPRTSLFEKTSVAGAGYINVTLSARFIAERLTTVLHQGVDALAPELPVKHALVDFSSPNIAKELHVGHLRSTVIGDSVARMLEFCNVSVMRRNHVGDWGTQFGMLLEHIFETGAEVEGIGDLQKMYVEASERFKSDEQFKAKAQQGVVKLQRSEAEYHAKWKSLCDVSRRAYERTYGRLNVSLEEKGESFYHPYIPYAIKALEEKGLLQESDGARVIFLEGYDIPLIVTKTDGAITYATTDLAALWYRVHVEKAEWIIYVTDVGQKQHFDMFFQAAKLAGWLPEHGFPKAQHIGFGMVLGEDGKRIRGRKGGVLLANLLDDAKSRSHKELIERGRKGEWSGQDLEAAAEALGYGAVKYADLKNNRETNYRFDFDQMLDIKGNTAVYLFYAYARVCSIIRKSGRSIDEIKQICELVVEHPHERSLGLHLIQFTETVEDSISRLLPSTLCDYLYTLSELFTQFYTSCKVNGSLQEASRLLLCEAARLIMKQGLELLGLTPLERL